MISSLAKKSNIVTFLGIAFSVLGMCFCFNNLVNYAILMLILGGICDGFDGPIARKLNKGESNEYGIQLDSFADIICAGCLPVIICLSLGYHSWINMIVYVLFVLCGVTRLTYYNVNSTDKKYFEGVPITLSTMVTPWVYFLFHNEIAFMIALTTLAVLFVSRLKVKKPAMKLRIILSVGGVALITAIFLIIR